MNVFQFAKCQSPHGCVSLPEAAAEARKPCRLCEWQRWGILSDQKKHACACSCNLEIGHKWIQVVLSRVEAFGCMLCLFPIHSISALSEGLSLCCQFVSACFLIGLNVFAAHGPSWHDGSISQWGIYNQI